MVLSNLMAHSHWMVLSTRTGSLELNGTRVKHGSLLFPDTIMVTDSLDHLGTDSSLVRWLELVLSTYLTQSGTLVLSRSATSFPILDTVKMNDSFTYQGTIRNPDSFWALGTLPVMDSLHHSETIHGRDSFLPIGTVTTATLSCSTELIINLGSLNLTGTVSLLIHLVSMVRSDSWIHSR